MDKNKQFYVNLNLKILENEKYDKYGILIYLLLLRNITMRNKVPFSMNDLGNKLNIKQTNNRMVNKVKDIIIKSNKITYEILNDNNEFINNSKEIEYNKIYILTIKDNYIADNSIKIYDWEIDKLLDYIRAINIDKFEITLYLVYLYSKSRNSKLKGFVLDVNEVSKDLKIKEGNIYRYNKILKELKLIDFEIIEYRFKDTRLYNSKKFNNLFYYSEMTDSNLKENTILEYQNTNTDKIFNEKEIIKKGFIEEDLENFLIDNLNKIEDGLKFVDRQHQIDNGVIDILARDRDDKLCIIELKVVSDCKDLVFQCVYYPTQFSEPTRMITVCPNYQNKIRESLDSLKYVEMYKYKVKNNDLNTIKINKIT